MKTRCKVTCQSVTENSGGYSYSFDFVTGGSEENDKFFKYTPHGKFEFGTTEEREFEVGKEYYIDIALVSSASDTKRTDASK